MSLRDILLRMHEEVEEWIRELCGEGYTVVLFGSRARGEARIDSDWDLVVIGDKPPREPPNDLVQLHYATPQSAIEEVRRFNTVFLDAFYEGRLICGSEQFFNELRKLAVDVSRGFVKTRNGWFRAG